MKIFLYSIYFKSEKSIITSCFFLLFKFLLFQSLLFEFLFFKSLSFEIAALDLCARTFHYIHYIYRAFFTIKAAVRKNLRTAALFRSIYMPRRIHRYAR